MEQLKIMIIYDTYDTYDTYLQIQGTLQSNVHRRVSNFRNKLLVLEHC